MKIKILKAFNGDSILVSYCENTRNRNILIDGGLSATYMKKSKKGKIEFGELKETIEDIKKKGEIIDLLILSHVDDDHIGGILKWFENDSEAHALIGKVWFNSGRIISEYFEHEEISENLIEFNYNENTNTSIGQGVKFEDYIEDNNIWERRIISAKEEFEFLGVKFRILSPKKENLVILLKKWEKENPESIETAAKKNDYSLTLKELIYNDEYKEDTSESNGSSIAFILTYECKNFLFLADAHPMVIIDSLKYFGFSEEKPINAELVKISHHGSKANNSKELLHLINSKKLIISTNGKKHTHPDKHFLGRLASLNDDCDVYFNYPELIAEIFLEEDYKDFPNFRPKQMKNNEFSI